MSIVNTGQQQPPQIKTKTKKQTNVGVLSNKESFQELRMVSNDRVKFS